MIHVEILNIAKSFQKGYLTPQQAARLEETWMSSATPREGWPPETEVKPEPDPENDNIEFVLDENMDGAVILRMVRKDQVVEQVTVYSGAQAHTVMGSASWAARFNARDFPGMQLWLTRAVAEALHAERLSQIAGAD